MAARPARFDRVDRVKAATGHRAQPGDEKLWILGDALTFLVDGRVHCVPPGFVTNGSSVPRIGRLLTGPWWRGSRRWPIVCHDWLYCHPLAARSYADVALEALLHGEGARLWARGILYCSTRLLGGRAFAQRSRSGPVIYDKGATMNDDLADDDPTVEVAAASGTYLWSTTTPTAKRPDTVRFEATGRTYADLRQTATDMLTALLGEATVEGRIHMNLEIEPEVVEMGSETPASWRAEVTAVIPSH